MQKEAAMRVSVMTLLCATLLFQAVPALAGGGPLTTMMDATQEDYRVIKSNFRAAYELGCQSWEEYGEATGFRVGQVTARIKARRDALRLLKYGACERLPKARRGLVRMLIRDLDDINISLLALAGDGRGYAGLIRTRDNALARGVGIWQEGIRLGIDRTKRCINMAKGAVGPLFGMREDEAVTAP